MTDPVGKVDGVKEARRKYSGDGIFSGDKPKHHPEEPEMTAWIFRKKPETKLRVKNAKISLSTLKAEGKLSAKKSLSLI